MRHPASACRPPKNHHEKTIITNPNHHYYLFNGLRPIPAQ